MKPKGIPSVQTGTEIKLPITPFSSPKERFQSDAARIKFHQDLVDKDAFDVSTDAALAEFVTNIGRQASDPNRAMSVGFQLRGAIDFLHELKTLAEQPKPKAKAPNPDNLEPTDPFRRP
jgi:hypothetical protein